MSYMGKIALRFRPDLAEQIEANRRRSISYVEDLTIDARPKMV